MGEWVGLIVDGAEGQNSAILASGVTDYSDTAPSASIANTGPDSTNEIISGNADAEPSEINIDSNAAITNNINIGAESGDATVSKNTEAGNATSGNALAAANILNVTQSNFSLGGWMGIVFINVLGDWFGSFGVDTDYGNPTLPSPEQVESTAANKSNENDVEQTATSPSGSPATNSNTYAYQPTFVNSEYIADDSSVVSEDGDTTRRDKKDTAREASFLSTGSNTGNTNLMVTASISAIIVGGLMLAAQRAFEIASSRKES